MPFAQHSIRKTSRSASTFLLSAVWIVLALASARELSRLASPMHADVAREAIAAAFLFGGFYLLARFFVPDLRPLSSVGFVRRPSAGVELAQGLALGWGIAIALVLPALLTGNLTMSFAFNAATILGTLEGMVTLGAFACVVQLILAGLPVRMLLNAAGSTWTAVAVVLVATVLSFGSQGKSLPVTALASYVLVAAFLRTRAMWVGLGIQIGWTLSLQILFGATSPYTPTVNGVITSFFGGPAWLTGGPFGPETSMPAAVVLGAATVMLYRLTRDYAWHYTWQPLEGAGQPMDVAPPAEHLREEAKKQAAPLVQIGGIQPAPQRAEPLE